MAIHAPLRAPPGWALIGGKYCSHTSVWRKQEKQVIRTVTTPAQGSVGAGQHSPEGSLEAEAVGPSSLPRRPGSKGNSGCGLDPPEPLDSVGVPGEWVPFGDPEEPSRK